MRHLLLAALLSLPTAAAADAIPDQPPCPAGATRVINGHEVIYCRPTTCDADGACEGEATCQTLGLCVSDVTRHVATTFPAEPGDPGRDVSYQDATATCTAGDSCESGGGCQVARRCAAPPPAAPAEASDDGPSAETDEEPEDGPSIGASEASPGEAQDDEGGGCAVGGAGATGGWLALGLALTLARLRRRGGRARGAPSAR